MKLNSIIFLMLALFMASFAPVNTKTCGLVDIFSKPLKLETDNFINIQENLQLPYNGQSFTIMGWVNIANESPQGLPLVKISIRPNENEGNFPETLKHLVTISYATPRDENPYLLVSYVDRPNNFKQVKIPFYLPKNQWIFWSYGFDYYLGVAQLHFNYQTKFKNILLKQKFKLNYPSFFLRRELDINVGCFSSRNIENQNCLKGTAFQFHYILEYFDDFEYLYLLDSDAKSPINFNFDVYQYQNVKNYIYSKDGSEFPLEIGGRLSFESSKTKSSILIKGFTEFRMRNVLLRDRNQIVNSPSFHFVLNYLEPLPQTMDLLKIIRIDNSLAIRVTMNLDNLTRRRYLLFTILGSDIKFKTPAIFEQSKVQRFTISFIQNNSQFWVFIDHPQQRVKSKKYALDMLSVSDVVLFNSNQPFNGGALKIYQLNYLPNASGVFYNFIQSPRNKTCNKNCKIMANLNLGYQRCIECSKDFVLIPSLSMCRKYCPLSFKNVGGICVKCYNEQCPELPKKYFKFSKTSYNTIELEQLTSLNFNGATLDKIFKVSVLNKKFKQDYIYTVQFVRNNQGKKILEYNFLFRNDKYPKNQTMVFELDPKIGVNNAKKNQIPIQVVKFVRLSTSVNPDQEFFDYVPKKINYSRNILNRPVQNLPPKILQKDFRQKLNSQLNKVKSVSLNKRIRNFLKSDKPKRRRKTRQNLRAILNKDSEKKRVERRKSENQNPNRYLQDLITFYNDKKRQGRRDQPVSQRQRRSNNNQNYVKNLRTNDTLYNIPGYNYSNIQSSAYSTPRNNYVQSQRSDLRNEINQRTRLPSWSQIDTQQTTWPTIKRNQNSYYPNLNYPSLRKPVATNYNQEYMPTIRKPKPQRRRRKSPADLNKSKKPFEFYFMDKIRDKKVKPVNQSILNNYTKGNQTLEKYLRGMVENTKRVKENDRRKKLLENDFISRVQNKPTQSNFNIKVPYETYFVRKTAQNQERNRRRPKNNLRSTYEDKFKNRAQRSRAFSNKSRRNLPYENELINQVNRKNTNPFVATRQKQSPYEFSFVRDYQKKVPKRRSNSRTGTSENYFVNQAINNQNRARRRQSSKTPYESRFINSVQQNTQQPRQKSGRGSYEDFFIKLAQQNKNRKSRHQPMKRSLYTSYQPAASYPMKQQNDQMMNRNAYNGYSNQNSSSYLNNRYNSSNAASKYLN